MGLMPVLAGSGIETLTNSLLSSRLKFGRLA
jgi:hypothetical protein